MFTLLVFFALLALGSSSAKKGLEYAKRRYLRDGLFEIKTNDVRALFKFQEERIILIGLVYEKRSNKAPDYYINLAQKRLKEV